MDMNKLIGTAIMAASLGLGANAAFAAEQITETRAVDARVVKIRLNGIVNLNVRQGATASLTLTGDKKELVKVHTRVQGDTLIIDSDDNKSFRWGKNSKHDVQAELTLPAMNEFNSQGVGATDVQGFTGEQIRLVLDGAGAITVTSRYKNIDARLGGVGSITLNAGDTERVDLNMRGAGHIEVNGQSKMLRAKLGGVGSLDAQQLRADVVDLDLTGLGGATVYAKNSATLNLTGLGSAEVYGKPASRNATARGLGSVTWH
jgi:hypothetical protein